jgi:hypothetical protein
MKVGCCSELCQISMLQGLTLVELAACIMAAKSPLEDGSQSLRAAVVSSDTSWNWGLQS